MAGTVGFEPTHAEIKTQSLTTWRRPNNYNYYKSASNNVDLLVPFATKPCQSFD